MEDRKDCKGHERRTTLSDLPVEVSSRLITHSSAKCEPTVADLQLVHSIHLLSLSPSLPVLNTYFHSLFSPVTSFSPRYRASYILEKLSDEGLKITSIRKRSKTLDVLNQALTYDICDTEVLIVLEEMCMESLGFLLEPLRVSPPPTISEIAAFDLRHSLDLQSQGKRLYKFLGRRQLEIPKRFFRSLPSTCPPFPESGSTGPSTSYDVFDTTFLPFLSRMLFPLRGNPNSFRGYPLAKAVLARHLPLIQLLLENGADPSMKDGMSVMLAIGRNDIEVVRVLVERHPVSLIGQPPAPASYSLDTFSRRPANSLKRQISTADPVEYKKRRLEDRIRVTPAMLELAVKQQYEPLIEYFTGKGVVPNLRTLNMLGWGSAQ
ncbi:MAG: hypothetical protein CYPHOPRED_004516 [Cyphobasidiales sp. Tagirdzhanova-0007]|nr:MAG: hypothetical protein CYPHOPRED_004516 [Cyphobasidiales sp. Tagirdzhanova-0007]